MFQMVSFFQHHVRTFPLRQNQSNTCRIHRWILLINRLLSRLYNTSNNSRQLKTLSDVRPTNMYSSTIRLKYQRQTFSYADMEQGDKETTGDFNAALSLKMKKKHRKYMFYPIHQSNSQSENQENVK